MSNETESLRSALSMLTARRDRAKATLERLNSLVTALEEEIALEENSPDSSVLSASPSQSLTAPSKLEELRTRLQTTFQTRADIQPLPEGLPNDAGGVFSKMSVGNAAAQFLKNVGKAQKTVDIVTALQEGGQPTKSTNYYRLVYNTLVDRARRENSDVRKVQQNWTYRQMQ